MCYSNAAMLLILAMLLAVSQTPSPVPGKAADNPAGTSRPADSQPKDNKEQPAQSQTPIKPVPAQTDEKPAEKVASDDASKTIRVSELPSVPITRDWVDHISWVSTLLLVVAGFRAIYVARQTLKVIARQALSMRRQTTIMRNSVAAAERSASAAKASADALIHSERAWIMVDLEPAPAPRVTWVDGPYEPRPPYWSEAEHHGVDLHITLKNEGKTPAWITDSFIRFEITPTLNEHPDFTPRELDLADRVPRPLAVGAKHEDDVSIKCERKGISGDGVVYAYGFVKYRDAFGEGRETRFGYMIAVAEDQSSWRWERVKNPNYNKHT